MGSGPGVVGVRGQAHPHMGTSALAELPSVLAEPLSPRHSQELWRLPGAWGAGRLRPVQDMAESHPPLFQVTLSYGGPENPRNVVNVAGGFSLQQDPTR